MNVTRIKAFASVLCLLCALGAPAAAQSADSQPPKDSSKTSTPHSGPTAAEIADAKAAHKVWVNLETGIYHKRGRWYGKTKNGKFMTEDDARKAGYKAAKRE